ncbi:hypothetical protein [Thioalkalivibrio sp. ALE31]|uniref:DsrE family protein n=1 Tax=Thioalkalivibrio sp. ALE31 TaxID=1158182 RepID=UPI00037A205D|nr:hypothetical protein [Thioalkalivibrio sp. ALE31]
MHRLLASFLLGALLLPGLALADKPGDQRAIAGMDTGRILWDITIGEPDRLIARLSVIRETYDDMQRQGLEPEMVFAFRGGAAGLIARSTDHLDIEDVSTVRHIHERLEGLLELDGIHMEACSIATRRFDLEQDDLLPGIHLVGNTFLSIMGYENQGYATIRID